MHLKTCGALVHLANTISIYNKYCLANARKNLTCRVDAASLLTSSLLFAFSSNWPNAAICLKNQHISMDF